MPPSTLAQLLRNSQQRTAAENSLRGSESGAAGPQAVEGASSVPGSVNPSSRDRTPTPPSQAPDGAPFVASPQPYNSNIEDHSGTPGPPLRSEAQARKRPADNLTPFVERVSQKLRLNKKNEKQLLSYSKLPSAERKVWRAGMQLLTLQQLGAIQPAEAPYVIPSAMASKIVIYSSQYILCSATSSYRSTAPGSILKLLEHHPSCGLTADVRNDERKVDVIMRAIKRCLTDCRSSTQKVIVYSLGHPHPLSTGSHKESKPRDTQNIVDLVNAAITELQKSRKIPSKEGVRISLEMCGRFAWLRKMYIEKHDNYWHDMDKQLASLREQFHTPGTNSQSAANDFFIGCLEDDLATYGDMNFDTSVDSVPSAYQKEVYAVATEDQETMEDGSGDISEPEEVDEEGD
ncbi:hypothetical protein K474DRAFT_1709557 [Panus rudis PR-1116 ss-1]|nr:hypothetical protein K474DRAFT_1709557 [Panus rudis PR-1116 ss-1]